MNDVDPGFTDLLDHLLSHQDTGKQVTRHDDGEPRRCPYCNDPLVRKPRERAGEFAKRSYCGLKCSRAAHRPMLNGIARRLWSA